MTKAFSNLTIGSNSKALILPTVVYVGSSYRKLFNLQRRRRYLPLKTYFLCSFQLLETSTYTYTYNFHISQWFDSRLLSYRPSKIPLPHRIDIRGSFDLPSYILCAYSYFWYIHRFQQKAKVRLTLIFTSFSKVLSKVSSRW